MELKSAVVFAILMENNKGIVHKSPAYILEKLRICERTNHQEYLEGLLDAFNKTKLHEWERIWEK